MKVTVEAKDVEEITADDRGRINLGMEFSGETVTVAVLEREAESDTDG